MKPKWPTWVPPFVVAISEDEDAQFLWLIVPKFKKGQWNCAESEGQLAVCLFIPEEYHIQFGRDVPYKDRILTREK